MLCTVTTSSRLVGEFSDVNVTLLWVLIHGTIEGNKRADGLIRRDSILRSPAVGTVDVHWRLSEAEYTRNTKWR